MKVNRNYYLTENDIEITKDERTIATVNGPVNYENFAPNTKMDESISYVKSKISSLPYDDIAIITPSHLVKGAENATNFHKQKYNLTNSNYVNLMLSYYSWTEFIGERTDPYDPSKFGLPSFNGTNGWEWGYNIDTSTTQYTIQNQRLFTGFDFRMFCGYIYMIAYSDPAGQNDGWNGYLADWDSAKYPYVAKVLYSIAYNRNYNDINHNSELFAITPQFSFKNINTTQDKNTYNADYPEYDNTSLVVCGYPEGGITLFGGVGKGSNLAVGYTACNNNPQTNFGFPFIFTRWGYVTDIQSHNPGSDPNSAFEFCFTSKIITKKIIEEWANAFGLYWAEDLDTAETAYLGKDCTNPKVHLPVIDENGVTTGKSETGKNTTKLPQSGWTNPDDVFNKNNVRPDDDNDYTTKQELNKPSVSPIGSFARTYAISGENVKLLSDKIWSGDDTAFKTFIDGLALMGENPINSIIDIRFYPFEIPNLGTSNKIVLGRNNTGIVGYPLSSVDNNIITFGTAKIMEKYNCFLDYPPYTKAELVIPNVGSIELDLTKVMGKNIKLQVIVDYVTGACTAVVFADNTIIHTLAGTIAIEVPITGTNSAQYASSVTNSLLSLPSSIGSAATGISSGNAAQAVSGITGTIGAVGNIISTPLPISSKNSATPMCSLFMPQYAYIRVTRPTFEEPDTYKSTFGYACNLTKRLGDMSGYAVCQNPIIENISATSDEINTIIQYLESGVII